MSLSRSKELAAMPNASKKSTGWWLKIIELGRILPKDEESSGSLVCYLREKQVNRDSEYHVSWNLATNEGRSRAAIEGNMEQTDSLQGRDQIEREIK